VRDPNWYQVLVLGFASWRTWCLLASDTILNAPRRYVTTRWGWTEEFFECPYCLGFWVAGVWFGAWLIFPQTVTALAALATVAGLVPIIQNKLASDE
jgi:hypothetical protein